MVQQNKIKKEQKVMTVLKSIQSNYDWRNRELPDFVKNMNSADADEWKQKQFNRYNAMAMAIRCVRACKAVNELPLIWKGAMQEVEKLDKVIEEKENE